MNRLTAIGLASLIAYGLLIATKYTGVVSAAREDKPATIALADPAASSHVAAIDAQPRQQPVSSPSPSRRIEPMRSSALAQEFRNARDLKAFADELAARRASLSADERYHLARALEECAFTMTVSEDLAAYSAKQRRQFLQSLTPGDPINGKRVAAYDAADQTQRCLRFQGTRMISQKDIEDLYAAAAQQGDARAQARTLLADLSNKANAGRTGEQQANARTIGFEDFSRMVGLLESRDPEAILLVGQFLAQSSIANQLRIGPSGETPEPAAFLGAFSLVVCDYAPDCTSVMRERQAACAFSGYCGAESFEEIYQNYLASPWTYNQAIRYRDLIHTAINTHNWTLIGLAPKRAPIILQQ